MRLLARRGPVVPALAGTAFRQAQAGRRLERIVIAAAGLS